MIRIVRKTIFASAALGVAVLCASPAWAAPPPASTAPSQEMREKMAQVHEKMAACLRSDKTIAECHREMKANCRAELGDRGCGMMQRRGMGMAPGRMMSPPPPPPPPPADGSTTPP